MKAVYQTGLIIGLAISIVAVGGLWHSLIQKTDALKQAQLSDQSQSQKIRDLEKKGIRIPETMSALLGSISTRITYDQVSLLSAVPGIAAVEYDEMNEAF